MTASGEIGASALPQVGTQAAAREFRVKVRLDALTVPLQAVVEQNGKTGIIGGLSIEVDGVADGTEIVAGPFQTLRDLRDGMRVRVR